MPEASPPRWSPGPGTLPRRRRNGRGLEVGLGASGGVSSLPPPLTPGAALAVAAGGENAEVGVVVVSSVL